VGDATEQRAEVLVLRRARRWGAAHIAYETGLAASTVQRILVAHGMGRLDREDRATEPVVRERDRPGELVHVDVKKLAAIPDGGGWYNVEKVGSPAVHVGSSGR